MREDREPPHIYLVCIFLLIKKNWEYELNQSLGFAPVRVEFGEAPGSDRAHIDKRPGFFA